MTYQSWHEMKWTNHGKMPFIHSLSCLMPFIHSFGSNWGRNTQSCMRGYNAMQYILVLLHIQYHVSWYHRSYQLSPFIALVMNEHSHLVSVIPWQHIDRLDLRMHACIFVFIQLILDLNFTCIKTYTSKMTIIFGTYNTIQQYNMTYNAHINIRIHSMYLRGRVMYLFTLPYPAIQQNEYE